MTKRSPLSRSRERLTPPPWRVGRDSCARSQQVHSITGRRRLIGARSLSLERRSKAHTPLRVDASNEGFCLSARFTEATSPLSRSRNSATLAILDCTCDRPGAACFFFGAQEMGSRALVSNSNTQGARAALWAGHRSKLRWRLCTIAQCLCVLARRRRRFKKHERPSERGRVSCFRPLRSSPRVKTQHNAAPSLTKHAFSSQLSVPTNTAQHQPPPGVAKKRRMVKRGGSHALGARIKRLMQKDDQVGKIAQATPVVIGE